MSSPSAIHTVSLSVGSIAIALGAPLGSEDTGDHDAAPFVVTQAPSPAVSAHATSPFDGAIATRLTNVAIGDDAGFQVVAPSMLWKMLPWLTARNRAGFVRSWATCVTSSRSAGVSPLFDEVQVSPPSTLRTIPRG